MSELGISLKRDFYPEKIAKQFAFASALALTKTAKDAQSGITSGLPNHFTLRGNWHQPSNKFGIKIKPAKKDSLAAAVGTNADWLEKFETGTDKLPRQNFLAVPTDNVRRNKKLIIQKSQRPAALRGKGDFVIQTKSGPVLFVRKGRGKKKQMVALYNLETKAKIKKNSAIIEPAVKVINGRLYKNFSQAFIKALKTAR